MRTHRVFVLKGSSGEQVRDMPREQENLLETKKSDGFRLVGSGNFKSRRVDEYNWSSNRNLLK
jgi:hypothetical protein